MKRILQLTAAACVLAGLTAGQARADIKYELKDVNLIFDSPFGGGLNQDAGILEGWFTTNDARTQLLAASIYASGATVTLTPEIGVGGFVIIPATYFSFTATEYTDDNSTVLNGLSLPFVPDDSLTFFKPSLSNSEEELFLLFDGHLNATGETLLRTSSHWISSAEIQEGEFFDYTRLVVSGSVTATAVPEPSTIAVVALCAPALLVYSRRRRKAASAA